MPYLLTLGLVSYAVKSAYFFANDLISKRTHHTRAEALQMAEEAKEMLRDANNALGDIRVK